MKDKKLQTIKIIMLTLNVAAVLFYAVFINVTTRNICGHYTAREFIANVNSIPWKPYQMNLYINLLLLGIVILFILREYIFYGNSKVGTATLVIDLIFSICIVGLLNFNYNGILLLVFANIIGYVKKNKYKYYFLILPVSLFLITDYELIEIKYRLFNIQSYIQYYDSQVQQYFLGAFNLLNSLNMIMFIMYCIYVIQKQLGTIDEVNSLYEKLSNANAELHASNIRLLNYAVLTEKEGETKERNRLAREIHDSLGHTLTAISAAVDACITTVENSPQDTKKRLEVIAGVTRQGILDIRRSVDELRPDSFQRLSLEYAITKMINDINTTTNTKVYFATNMEQLKFDEDEENTIFRIIQEGITNAIRHGNASKIWIKIEKNDSEIVVTVQDNGVGADVIKSGFGTRHLMERVEMLHGTVTFDGSHGFIVTARIPYRWGEKG